MKPRHAAALALVVWYLMLPPLVCDDRWCDAHLEAPITQWTRAKTIFSSQRECEDFRTKEIKAAKTLAEELPRKKYRGDVKEAPASFCIPQRNLN